MILLKKCPKCKGDLYVDSDSYGGYMQCLQCGLIIDCEQEHLSAEATLSALEAYEELSRGA